MKNGSRRPTGYGKALDSPPEGMPDLAGETDRGKGGTSLSASGPYTSADEKFPSGDGGNVAKCSPKSFA